MNYYLFANNIVFLFQKIVINTKNLKLKAFLISKI